MDVKEAVKLALTYVSDLFHSDGIFNLALEEVEYLDNDAWNVTVGFVRQWDVPATTGMATLLTGVGPVPPRTYKIVRISGGVVVSVKNREPRG